MNIDACIIFGPSDKEGRWLGSNTEVVVVVIASSSGSTYSTRSSCSSSSCCIKQVVE